MTIETLIRPATEHLVMRVPGGVQSLASLLVAGTLLAGASGPTYAASIDANRLKGSGTTQLAACREPEDGFDLAASMAELKLKAGLTWEELSGLLKVSRQTIHSWAKGSVIKAMHRERVEALLARVRAMKELKQFEVRRVLLGADADTALQPSSDPAILVSDRSLDVSRPKLRKGSSYRIVRGDGADG